MRSRGGRPSGEAALASLGVAGISLLVSWIATGGGLNGALGGVRAVLGVALGIATGTALGLALWRLTFVIARGAGRDVKVARAFGAVPLLPWLAGWPLALQATLDPLAARQLQGAGGAVLLYLAGWSLAGLAGVVLWCQAVPAAPERPPALGGVPAGTAEKEDDRGAAPGPAWWLVLPLLALAGTAYWNGAVLDPLQFRGFPDYVTQLGGARRLLAGELPYNPALRVWADVNLPPVTLLLLFAPFSALSDLGGKLAYALLNHLAFLAAVAVLLRIACPPRRVIHPLTWGAAVAALALSFEPWHDSLRLGQQNGVVLLCLVLCLAGLLAGRDALAGVALAAALIGKPSSALLGLYFLFARRWRAVLGAALAGGAAFLVTLPWTGWEPWRFYVLDKAPQILAGTPQQSNVALLALHARLFLPPDALSSFDAMPALPLAQTLTRVAQALGVLALWRLTAATRRPPPLSEGVHAGGPAGRLTGHLELAVALVLSLSLVGHAWQSYVTWLLIAFVPLVDPRTWGAVPGAPGRALAGLAVAGYAGIALHDVPLYRVIGNASGAATVFASLPNVLLLVLAFALAALCVAQARRGA